MGVKNKTKLTDRIFSDNTALITAGVSMAILFFAVAIFLIFRSWSFSWVIDEQIVGQFGDFIGGVVGTLLAFAAACLYYVALKEQRKDVENNRESLKLQNQALKQQIDEFRQQRVELEETRKVYEKQTALMTEQSRIMRQQQFESSFYSLMRLYIDCKEILFTNDVDRFKYWIELLVSQVPADFKEKGIYERHLIIMSLFEDLYVANRGFLTPYFKTVYRILSLIDNANSLNEKDKMFYVKIFRALLNDYEIMLLYYNYHSYLSGKGKNLAYKFNFLKHYDYFLSVDAQCVYECGLIQNPELQLFLREFESFLKSSINEFCDGFSEEEQNPQTNFDYQNIIAEISCNPDILIKISVPIGQEVFNKTFCNLLSDFIQDRLFLSQFSSKNEALLLSEVGVENSRRIYSCTIHSDFVQKVGTDIDYE